MAAAVTGPVKVSVARYLGNSGVFPLLPKWDKSRSLLPCDKFLLGYTAYLSLISLILSKIPIQYTMFDHISKDLVFTVPFSQDLESMRQPSLSPSFPLHLNLLHDKDCAAEEPMRHLPSLTP